MSNNGPTQEKQGAMSTRLITGCLNVEKLRGRSEVRTNFWAVRVVDSWNSLPDAVKTSPSVNFVKNSLDNLMEGGRL